MIMATCRICYNAFHETLECFFFLGAKQKNNLLEGVLGLLHVEYKSG